MESQGDPGRVPRRVLGRVLGRPKEAQGGLKSPRESSKESYGVPRCPKESQGESRESPKEFPGAPWSPTRAG